MTSESRRIYEKVRRVLKVAAAPIKLSGSQATGIASFSASRPSSARSQYPGAPPTNHRMQVCSRGL